MFLKPRFLKQLEVSTTFIAIVVLMSIFGYWSSHAFIKYSRKPVSTTISFNYGDSNDGNIAFPAITICPDNFQSMISHGVTQFTADLELDPDICYCAFNTKCENYYGLFRNCLNAVNSLIPDTATAKIKPNWKDLLIDFNFGPDIAYTGII